MNKTRQVNLDLLRIISMIMVITLHYFGKNELLDKTNLTNEQYYVYYFLEVLCIVAVNCYILISGYFLYNSEFKIKKFFCLWGEVIFYSVLIYIVLYFTGMIEFNIKEAIKSFFPVLTKQYWFISCYLVLYLLSPFLNKLINSLNKKEFQKLLVLLLIIFSILTILPVNMTLDGTCGYGIIWFVCLYFVGAYIRNHYNKNQNRCKIYFCVYFIIALIIFVAILTLKYISNKYDISDYSNKLLCYNNILVFLESISLFLFFNKLDIKDSLLSKTIIKIAPLTFAVYIIHEHSVFRSVLYNKILKVSNYYNNNTGIIIAIASIFSIFILCVTIEYIRKMITNLFVKIFKNEKI